MGKKKGKSSTVQHRETFQRMNYLYQAAHCVLRQCNQNVDVSRFYATTMKSIARKDPSVKRTLCKRCSSLLVPGTTARVRVKGKRQCHVVVTCCHCKRVKRFNCSSNHLSWTERSGPDHEPRRIEDGKSGQMQSAKDVDKPQPVVTPH